MTPAQQTDPVALRVAVAERCGLKPCRYHLRHHLYISDCILAQCTNPIPDYPASLDAMATALATMSINEVERYHVRLCQVVGKDSHENENDPSKGYIELATAEQQATAFLPATSQRQSPEPGGAEG